jgi:hypothetical protein
VTASYGPDQRVAFSDSMYTDRQAAQNVACDFICVLSAETTSEQIDELSEDEFPSLIKRGLGDLLT